MIPWQRSAGLPISRDQNACAGEEKCLPFQIGMVKWSRINLLLILPEPPYLLLECAF